MAEDNLNNNLPQPAPGVPDRQFQYTPISEFQIPPALDMLRDDMDPEYLTSLTKYASSINNAFPPAVGNMNTPFPTNAVGEYNPVSQQKPPSLNTQEGTDGLTNDILNFEPGRKNLNPYITPNAYADRDRSSFDRFYMSSAFDDLGWHPYADNESYYNENTTVYDDMARMRKVYGGLLKTGFMSAYRSIGDLTDGDDYFSTADLESSREFERAMMIGNSSRGGKMAFVNNLGLQSAYTFGILSSIAVEELAIGLGTLASGGSLGSAGAVRTTSNVARGLGALKDLFTVGGGARATRNMLSSMKNLSTAKGFFNAAVKRGEGFVNFLTPNTLQGIKAWNTTANGAQNLSHMAKVGRTFGGFYRDARALNYATSEGKMEAGMVYDEQLNQGYHALKARAEAEGRAITTNELENIQDAAYKASYADAIGNTPFIYLTNNLLLGNALGGFNRGISRMMNNGMSGLAKKVTRVKPKINPKTGKFNKDVFGRIDAKTGIGETAKEIGAAYGRSGVRGVAGMGARGLLTYASMNVGEGIQEVYQEALAIGTRDYYNKILLDSSMAGYNAEKMSVYSAVENGITNLDSQMNERGFETFMSGFLMGGIVRGPQKLFFDSLPKLYDRVINSETYKENQDLRENYINAVMTTYNTAWNAQAEDPQAVFDLSKINLISQVTASADINTSMIFNEMMTYKDAKDSAKFTNIYSLLDMGGVDFFREQLEDMNQMTDEELKDAIPELAPEDIKTGKARTRINNMIAQVDRLEAKYINEKDSYPNKFDPSQYKKGTKEHTLETIKFRTFEHARYIKMFADESFLSSVKRSESIMNDLSSDSVISKIAATDITNLLDIASIETEMFTLATNAASLQESLKEQEGQVAENSRKIIEFNSKKLDALNEIKTILTQAAEKPGEKETTADIEIYKQANKQELVEKLRKPFLNYLDIIAADRKGFVDGSRVDEVLMKLVDYDILTYRAKAYNKTLTYLTNPKRLDQLAMDMVGGMKEVFQNSRDTFKKSIEEYVSQNEINQFLNELDKAGVYPIPQEVTKFIKTNDVDVLQTFYAESGLVDPNFNAELFEDVQAIKESYRLSQKPKEATEEEKQQTKKNDVAEKQVKLDEEVVDVLTAEGAEDIDFKYDKTNNNPFAKEMLDRLFKDYKLRQSQLKKASKKKAAWTSSLGQKYVKTYENLKKLYIAKIQDNVTEEELKSIINDDIQFDEFLNKSFKSDSPSVYEILDIYDVRVKEILPNYVDEADTEADASGQTSGTFETDVDIDPDNIDFSSFPGDIDADDAPTPSPPSAPQVETTAVAIQGKNFNVIEIAISQDDSIFRIVNKDGSAIEQDILDAGKIENNNFQRRAQANTALNILDALDLSDADPTFTFGGIEVYPGLDLKKTKGSNIGKEYVVYTSKQDIEGVKKPKLYLIPRDKYDDLVTKSKASLARTKAVLKVNENDFAKNFTIDEGETLLVGPKASRLERREAIGFYPIRLETSDGYQESAESFNARTQFILSNLTPKDVANLRFRITREENAGVETGDYNVNPTVEEANPLIKKIRSPFKVEVLLPTDKVAIMNKILSETNLFYLAPNQTTIETIGFLPMRNIKALDKSENEIELDQPIEDKSLFYSIFKKIKGIGFEKHRDEVANNFTIQYAFENKVEDVIGNKQEVVVAFSDLRLDDFQEDFDVIDGFNLQLKSRYGYLKQGTKGYQENNLKELDQYTYDGATVVMTNNRIPNSTEVSTNIKFTNNTRVSVRETVKRQNAIKQQLQEAGIYESLQNMGRYVAVIKTTSGELVGASLKSPTIQDETLDTLLLDLFTRAATTINANTNVVGGKYSVKDNGYNRRWNREFNERFYIATKKGYILNLNVTPDGSIQLELFSKRKLKKGGNLKIADFYLDQNEVKQYAKASQDRASFMDSKLKEIKEELTNYYTTLTNSPVVKPNKTLLSLVKEASTDIDLSNESFRKSFAKESGVNEIVDNTVTNLDPRVRFDYNLYLQTGLSPKDSYKDTSFIIKSRSTLTDATSQKQSQEEEIESELGVETPTESISVDDELKKLVAKKTQLSKRLSGESKSQQVRRLKDDAEFQAVLKRINELSKGGYKLVGPDMGSMYDIAFINRSDLTTFTEWATENLPDFITIKDIDTLKNNLAEGFITLGKFSMHLKKIAGGIESLQGNMYVGARNKYKYHEAGHAVFRMLLTDEEQRSLLNAARERQMDELGEEYEKKVLEHREYFRAQGLVVPNRITSILEDSYLEEYIMDEFEVFKRNPRAAKVNSETKSWFNKLIEWIRSVLGLSKESEKDVVTEFFRDIDSGKFRNYSAVDNRFTRMELDENQELTLPNAMLLNNGVTREAFALLKIVEEDGSQRHVNQQLTDEVIRSIAARGLDIQDLNADNFIEDSITQAYDEYVDLYDSERPRYNTPDFIPQRQDLLDIESALLEQSDNILRGISEYLAIFDVKLEIEQELNEEAEESVGIRNVGDFNRDASMLGGIENAPVEIRKFLSTTALSRRDFFGNEELSPGVPIRIPIDPNKAFSGILKAVMNEMDQVKVLQRLDIYSQSNPNTKAVVDRIFDEFGISREEVEAGEITSTMTKPNEFNRLMKTIINFRTPYTITQRFRDEGTLHVINYSAFNRDAANSQIDSWAQAYITKRNALREEFVKNEVNDALDALLTYLDPNEASSITNVLLEEDTQYIHETLLEYVGISLSPNFIKYSILDMALSNTTTNQLEEETRVGQKEFYYGFTNVLPIEQDDIQTIKTLLADNKDLFSDTNEGMKSKMSKLSLRNAQFDENIGLSVFKNEDGNLVFGHQLPTYELSYTEELNDLENNGAKIDDLRESDTFLSKNYLLNSPFFKQLSAEDRLHISRSGGSVTGKIGVDEDSNIEVGKTREAVTYGKQNGKEFLKNLIDAYFNNYNPAQGKVDTVSVTTEFEGRTITEEKALAPILTRIIETSNTGNKVPLEVIRAVEKTVLENARITDEYIEAVIQNILTEFNNIQLESNPETRTQILIPNYNSDSNGLARKESTTLVDDEGEILIDDDGNPIVEYTKGYKFYEGGAEKLLKPAQGLVTDERRTSSFITSQVQAERLRDNKQKYVVYREQDAKKKINFVTEGETRKGLLSYKDESENATIHNFRVVSVNEDMTNPSIRQKYLKNFGDAIVEEKSSTHTFPIKIADKTFYTDVNQIGTFFSRSAKNKNKKFVVYEIIERKTEEEELDQALIEDLSQLGIDADSSLQEPIVDPATGNEMYNFRSEYASSLLERDNETGEILDYDTFTQIQGAETKADIDKILKAKKISFTVDNEKIKNIVKIYIEDLISNDSPISESLFATEGPLKTEGKDKFSKQLALAISEVRDELKSKAKQDGAEVGDYFIVNGYADALAEEARKAGKNQKLITLEEALSNIGSNLNEFKAYIRTRLDETYSGFAADLKNVMSDDFSSYLTSGLTTISGVETADTDKSNELLNLRKNTNYNLKQIYLNDYLMTTAWNQILHGNPAKSFSGPVNEVKRAKLKNLAIKNIQTISTFPEANITSPVEFIAAVPFEEPTNASTHSGKKIKVADAQLYGTTKSILYELFGYGELTKPMLEILQKIELGETITEDEYFGAGGKIGFAKAQAMLHSRKLAYSDGKTQAKFSKTVLTFDYTSIDTGERVEKVLPNGETILKRVGRPNPLRPELHNLRVKLENLEEQQELLYGKNAIAVAGPLSVFKTYKYNVNPIEDLFNTEPNISPLQPENFMALDPKYYGLQLVKPTNKEEVTDPSQIRVLATAEQSDDVEVTIQGEKFKMKDIKKMYNFSNKEKLTLNYTGKRNTLFTFDIDFATDELQKSIKQGSITENLISFLKYAESSLRASQSSGQMISFFHLDDLLDKDYNLNSSITQRKFEQLFLSYFKESLKQKIPGDSAALLSDFGNGIYRRVYSLDENGIPDRQEVIRDLVYRENFGEFDGISILDGEFKSGDDKNITQSNLAKLIEESNGEGVIIIDRLRSNMKHYADPKDENSWTGEREVETMFTAPNKEILRSANVIKDLSADAIENKFQKWIRNSNYSPKAERNIVRVDIEDFDVNRSRQEFASAFGFKYDKVDDTITFISQSVNIPELYSKMYGVRIPSQDKHSAQNVRVVDFLPTYYGSTIMSARELIEISGADFDIDIMYLHMKEYFEENGALLEYDNSFDHYTKYINKNVSKPGSTYSQALYRANYEGIAVEESDVLSRDAVKALTILKLPKTQAEYDAYLKKHSYKVKDADGKTKIVSYPPYPAPMNNQILDFKVALLGNEAIVNADPTTGKAIAQTPADIEAFTEAWNIFREEFPELAETTNAEDLDSNTLWGKFRAFVNNKSANIGAVVLPNTYLSLIREYNIKLNQFKVKKNNKTFTTKNFLRFNQETYDSFSGNYERLENAKRGRRVQEIVSALVTVMTDNAAEQLAGKFNLNRNATALATNILEMQVPLKTTVRLINNPDIVSAYNNNNTANKAAQEIANKIITYLQAFPELAGSDIAGSRNLKFQASKMFRDFAYIPVKQIEITDELLGEAINNHVKWDDVSELEAAIEAGTIDAEYAQKRMNIFNEFLKANQITQFTRKMSGLMNMSKGLGTSLETVRDVSTSIKDLGLDLTDKQIEAMRVEDRPIMDLRPIMKDSFIGTYLDIHNELENVVLPTVFLSETEMFKDIVKTVTDNRDFIRSSDKSALIRDVLSYVTVRGYMYERQRRDPLIVSRLSNDLLYSQQNNIVSIVEDTKRILGEETNTFLDIFSVPIGQFQEGNKTGMSMVAANTFARLTDDQRILIQSDFVKLFADGRTRQNAIDILHYMMIKDGLQLAYQGLVGALSPQVLNSYFGQIDLIHDAFKNNKKNNIPRLMGVTYDELINDFALKYPMMARASKYVTLLKTNNDNKIPIYNNELPIGVSSRDINESYVKENPETLFVIPDVESGIGVNTYSKIRKLDNVITIPYKKNIAETKGAYYKKADIEDYAQTLSDIFQKIEADMEEGRKVLLPKTFISRKELKTFKKSTSNGIITQLKGFLSENFGYSLYTGSIDQSLIGSLMNISNPNSVKVLGTSDLSIKNNSVYIDSSLANPTLIFQPFKGLMTYENVSDNPVEQLAFPRLDAKQFAKFENIASFYRAIGIKPVQKTVKGRNITEFQFPPVLTYDFVGGAEAQTGSTRKTRFVLKAVRSADPGASPLLFNSEKITRTGLYAEYIEEEVKGSYQASPIGFIFPGNIPAKSEIQATIQRANSPEDIDGSSAVDMTMDQFDTSLFESDGENVTITPDVDTDVETEDTTGVVSADSFLLKLGYTQEEIDKANQEGEESDEADDQGPEEDLKEEDDQAPGDNSEIEFPNFDPESIDFDSFPGNETNDNTETIENWYDSLNKGQRNTLGIKENLYSIKSVLLRYEEQVEIGSVDSQEEYIEILEKCFT